MDSSEKLKIKQKIMLGFLGFLSGVVNGFFGAGGGLVIVPGIKLIGKVESKKAHATSILIVLSMCLVSGVVYTISGNVEYGLVGNCLIGAILGCIIGTFALKKFKNIVVEILFSIILIFCGIMMITL
ncbi:MAG: sulfite exporter TauE/SafE family protein [Clostridia bacterium]|nr:sulfite exporter TauE/SafE family protein [Clostridia bacterium]